jgi:hypothetical protein
VIVYSIDNYRKFQPRRLVEKITPEAIKSAIQNKDSHKALTMALALNDDSLIEASLNMMVYAQSESSFFNANLSLLFLVPTIIRHLNETEAGELLNWLAGHVAKVGRTRINRYFAICRELIYTFGHSFKAQIVFNDSITAIQQYFHMQKDVLDL